MRAKGNAEGHSLSLNWQEHSATESMGMPVAYSQKSEWGRKRRGCKRGQAARWQKWRSSQQIRGHTPARSCYPACMLFTAEWAGLGSLRQEVLARSAMPRPQPGGQRLGGPAAVGAKHLTPVPARSR